MSHLSRQEEADKLHLLTRKKLTKSDLLLKSQIRRNTRLQPKLWAWTAEHCAEERQQEKLQDILQLLQANGVKPQHQQGISCIPLLGMLHQQEQGQVLREGSSALQGGPFIWDSSHARHRTAREEKALAHARLQ